MYSVLFSKIEFGMDLVAERLKKMLNLIIKWQFFHGLFLSR